MEAIVKIFLITIVFLYVQAFANDISMTEQQDLVVKNMETCFSPKEGCDQKLIGVINSAKKTLDVAIFSITHTGIASAIIAAQVRGVAVRMVVDKGQSEGTKSQTDELLAAKIPLKMGNAAGIMHDKYCIVDEVIMETGSFNYTTSATNYNTENQIYISDKKVLKRYQDNFENLWNEAVSKTNPSSLDD